MYGRPNDGSGADTMKLHQLVSPSMILTHLKGLSALFAVLVGILVGVALAWPFLLAEVCPACMAFAALEPDVYIERGATSEQQDNARAILAGARSRLRLFYGDSRSHPRIFICEDQACYDRIGGGRSRGMAIFDWALFLAPHGTSSTIAAHEMSHVELHARLGLLKTYRRLVPQWFDEGAAVLVSNDPRYLGPSMGDDRCLASPGGPLPTSRQAWLESEATTELYAKAACRVKRWTLTHGGPSAIMKLLDRVASGVSFDEAYQAAPRDSVTGRADQKQ
jgi:hypothetical protein